MMAAILLVEDNQDDADLALRALRKNRLANHLVHVTDGVEALEYLRAEGPFAGRDSADLPALILLDLKLPRMEGLEVLKHIRADGDTHRIPVVILTSSRGAADMTAGYDLGVNGYVRKPVDFTEVVGAVQTLRAYWLLVNERPPR